MAAGASPIPRKPSEPSSEKGPGGRSLSTGPERITPLRELQLLNSYRTGGRQAHEALSELLEEGVMKRIQRYKKMAALIRERMAKIGIKPVLPPECQSNTITAFHLPDGMLYATLHDRLKAEGYVIYAGQGQLERKIFRVANMGALTEVQFNNFLDAFEQACKQA